MWKDVKFLIIIALLVIAIAVGATLGGIALTRDNNKNVVVRNVNPELQFSGNVSGMLGILKDLGQAKQEIISEGLDAYLQQLVKDGKITQEQADKIKSLIENRLDNQQSRNFSRQMPFGGMRNFGRNMPFGGNQNGNNPPVWGSNNTSPGK